jgi:hypothetical protein
MSSTDQGGGKRRGEGIQCHREIATGIATGRIKTDRNLGGRYNLVIAVKHNKISTSGTVRDEQIRHQVVFKTGALNHSATLPSL